MSSLRDRSGGASTLLESELFGYITIERIFRLLGLIRVQRDIYTAYRGLNSPRREVRANAIELLENLLPGHVKKQLLALVDEEIPVQEKLKIELRRHFQA